MKKELNIVINVTLLKLIGCIVTLVGLGMFVWGCFNKAYVTESVGVVTLGLGTLGYRKYQTSKDKSNGNIQQQGSAHK